MPETGAAWRIASTPLEGEAPGLTDAEGEALTTRWMIEVGLIKAPVDFPDAVRAIWPGARVVEEAERQADARFRAELAQLRAANAEVYSGKRAACDGP